MVKLDVVVKHSHYSCLNILENKGHSVIKEAQGEFTLSAVKTQPNMAAAVERLTPGAHEGISVG